MRVGGSRKLIKAEFEPRLVFDKIVCGHVAGQEGMCARAFSSFETGPGGREGVWQAAEAGGGEVGAPAVSSFWQPFFGPTSIQQLPQHSLNLRSHQTLFSFPDGDAFFLVICVLSGSHLQYSCRTYLSQNTLMQALGAVSLLHQFAQKE